MEPLSQACLSIRDLPWGEPPGRPPVAVGPPVMARAVCVATWDRSSPSAQHPEWVTVPSVLPQAEPIVAKATRPLSGLVHSASPLPLKGTGPRGRSWPVAAHRPLGTQPASQAALVGGQCPATRSATPEPLCSEGGAGPAVPAAGRMAVASRHRSSRAGLKEPAQPSFRAGGTARGRLSQGWGTPGIMSQLQTHPSLLSSATAHPKARDHCLPGRGESQAWPHPPT